MRIVQKIICWAKFPYGNFYYLIKWGNWMYFKPTWMDKEELFWFIRDSKVMRLFDKYWKILESRTVKQQVLLVSMPPHTMTIKPNASDGSDGDNNIDPLDQYMLDYGSDNIIIVECDNDQNK